VRYDVEFPPQLSQPNALALAAYNQLGLQKGIQTDTNNIQPRIGLAWNPRGDARACFVLLMAIFYDHPLLGLYFLGDASDGSKSGQLLFAGGKPVQPRGGAQRGQLECDQHLPGPPDHEFVLAYDSRIPAKSAALRSFQRRLVHQPELSEPGPNILPW